MNRIYKVIWSKVKHQYIVVSELAHRDGKRSSVAGKSVKTMLAVCALCGAAMLGGYGMPNVYAAGADTLPGQYIAIGGATTAESTANDGHWEGRWLNREWVVDTYYRDLEDASGTTHKYVYTQGNDGNYYWVREGYSIEIVENKRYPTADKNTVINTYKGANADSDGLVQSYQNVQENMNIGTLNGDTLFTTNTDMYGGAVNTSTTAITTGQNYRIEQNGRYIEAGLNNLGSYFNTEDVVYHENTGLYTFHGQVVGTENLYVIGGNVGVFTTTANGDTLYTGDVYGRNNEILMTAVDEKGNLVSYWGAEIVDPNATIGSMTISTLEGKFDEVNKNIEKIHKDDIKEIQVAPTGTSTDGQGGTIGLQTNGAFDADGNPTDGKAIPGGITVTSIGGTNGNDVQVKFSNTDPDTKQTNSFTVNAGSKVVGKVGEVTATEGQTLDGISINGVDYKLGGGQNYTAGNNVHINGNVISADGTKVSADEGNFTVTPTTNKETNVTDYNIKLNNVVTVGSGENTKPVQIDGVNGQVMGLTNKTLDVEGFATSSRAATEEQLKLVQDGAANINLTNITEGGKTVIKGLEQHITPGEYKVQADGTVTMNYVDGNGQTVTGQTAKITGIASESAVAAAKTTVSSSNNISAVGTQQADGHMDYNVKLNDNVYLGGDQTADNSNIALEGSTGSIHAATTEGNHTFDFNSNGGKFETTTVDDSLLVDMPIIGKNGVVTTTTNTSEFNQRGATFTKTGKTETYVGDHIITTTPIPKTSTNINGSKITSDAGVLGGQTVVDGGSVTVQGVGSILGTNTTTVEGSKITSVGTWGSLLGDTTEIDGAYINAGGIEVNGEPLRDTITGLSNTEWKNDEAWQKTHIRDDRAATEGQLQDVADSLSGDVSKLDDFAVKYDEVNGKPNYDKVTLEGKDGTKITNLAKGEVTATSTDAVNGSQLFKVQELAGKHTTMTVNNGMVAPENGSYTTDGNLQLKQKVDDKGQIEYDVKLNDNLVLGKGDSQITLNGAPTDENAPAISVGEVFTVGQDGSVHAAVAGDSTSDSMSFTNGGLTISNMSGDVSSATVIKGADIQAGGIHLDGTDKIIDGLSNTEWTGMTTTPDKAATEGQLQMVSDRVASGWTATDDKGHEINVNPNTHPTLNFASGKNITVSAENDEINVALNDNVYLGEDNAIALEGSTGHISATVKDSLGMSSNTLTFDDKGLTVSKDAMGVGSGSTNIIGDMITTTDENGNETTIDGGKVTTEALEVNGNSDNTMTFDAAEGLNVNTGDAQLNVSEDGLSLNVDNGAGSNNSVKITQDGTTFSYSENGVTGATTTVIQGQKITAGDVLINGEDGKNTITGLTNTTWKNDAAWQADNIVADRAATEGQLQQAAAASKTTLSNGKNTTVTSNKTAEDGHVDYQVNLNDHIVLGDQDGKNNNISINGNEASIILNGFENGEYKNSIEIDAASGMITGLTNAIGDGKDGWETFTDKDTVHGSRAVTEDDLYEVYRHGVQYSVNDDGTPDYTTIVLGNPYNANTKGGGTRITNVAYAETDRKSTEYDGSAAVNVDVLNDAVDNATATVTGNEKHIATNVGPKAEMPHADYSVGEDGKVTLTEVDGNGKPTGNSVVISDVASATDVGNVDKLVDAGLGVDENGNSNVVDAILDVDNKVGDLNYNDVKGDSIQNGDDTTTAIGKLDNRIDGLETDISGAAEEAKKHNTVKAGSNIVVTTSQNANGGTEYKVSVDPNLKVDTVTASGNIDAGSFSTGDITINKDNSGTINGLSNTTWNKEVADAIAANANGEAGTAATQGQLQQAMNGAVQYDTNKDGSVNKDSITLGGSTYDPETHKGGTTITNVADGKNASDAVNMSQLWQTNQAVINNSNNIQSLSNQVGKLDNRIDRVGAGAAALAALHPLDFDPDAKWDFAAGYGNYRGANAVAVGAYYRPNEDVMFSVGGSMGGGENMVNAGVSLKIGAGSSNVTTSRVAMAKEIKSMRDIVAKQDAQIQKLTAMVNALVGIQSEPDTTTMFPDVPENHWAYEAVEAMAKSGLVKGYPDGEFKGDRTMTRYEFAQIVYNAIQAGAEVDARLVEEFKPELEYFHIATVAKDKDGNPTIERVRAN